MSYTEKILRNPNFLSYQRKCLHIILTEWNRQADKKIQSNLQILILQNLQNQGLKMNISMKE